MAVSQEEVQKALTAIAGLFKRADEVHKMVLLNTREGMGKATRKFKYVLPRVQTLSGAEVIGNPEVAVKFQELMDLTEKIKAGMRTFTENAQRKRLSIDERAWMAQQQLVEAEKVKLEREALLKTQRQRQQQQQQQQQQQKRQEEEEEGQDDSDSASSEDPRLAKAVSLAGSLSALASQLLDAASSGDSLAVTNSAILGKFLAEAQKELRRLHSDSFKLGQASCPVVDVVASAAAPLTDADQSVPSWEQPPVPSSSSSSSSTTSSSSSGAPQTKGLAVADHLVDMALTINPPTANGPRKPFSEKFLSLSLNPAKRWAIITKKGALPRGAIVEVLRDEPDGSVKARWGSRELLVKRECFMMLSSTATQAAAAQPQVSLGVAVARRDFSAKEDIELSFRKGDIVSLLRTHSSGWFLGELRGNVGWFPGDRMKQSGAGVKVPKRSTKMNPLSMEAVEDASSSATPKKKTMTMKGLTSARRRKKNRPAISIGTPTTPAITVSAAADTRHSIADEEGEEEPKEAPLTAPLKDDKQQRLIELYQQDEAPATGRLLSVSEQKAVKRISLSFFESPLKDAESEVDGSPYDFGEQAASGAAGEKKRTGSGFVKELDFKEIPEADQEYDFILEISSGESNSEDVE